MKNENPETVSLIMTLFNEEERLPVTLSSIAKQTKLPDEVVVCDAGSRDGTVAMMKAWAAQMPFPVKVLVKEGSNISVGRNVAIAAANSPIITVTDGSCELDEHWLERITAPLLRQNGSHELVYGSTVAVGKSKVGKFFAALHFARTHTKDKSEAEFSSRSVAFTKAIWQKVHGYPEWLSLAGEDTLFFIELERLTRRMYIEGAKAYWYHGAETPKKVYRMHRRNSIGSGEALMYPVRHFALFSIYAVLLGGICATVIRYPLLSPLFILPLLALLLRQSPAAYRQTKDIQAFLFMPILNAVRDAGILRGFQIGLFRSTRKALTDKPKYAYGILAVIDLLYALVAVTASWFANSSAELLFTGLSIPMALVLPGFLLLRNLRVVLHEGFESFVFSVGFSIFTLFAGGLAINTLLPFAGVSKPLDWTYVIPMITLVNAGLLFWGYRSNVGLLSQKTPHKTNGPEKALFVIAPLTTAVSVLGAISLNNGGSNTLALCGLISIGLYSAFLLCCKSKLKPSVYPYALFFSGLSFLLAVSLRGWVISGHDILSEYHVFELTRMHLRWNIGYLHDAYNACLSITLLPTVMSQLMPKISDQYILRIVFQAIAALMPVGVYYFTRYYLERRLAYVAALFFMAQSPFLRDFAYLTRQELATLFFILMLLALNLKNMSRRRKLLLILIFGWSMVVSHYSTTYVAIGMLSLALVFRSKLFLRYMERALNWVRARPAKISRLMHRRIAAPKSETAFTAPTASHDKFKDTWLPNWKIVLTLIVLTVAWNTWITHTSSNLEQFATSAYQSVTGKSSITEGQSQLQQQVSGAADEQDNSGLITLYATKGGVGGTNTVAGTHYPAKSYTSYSPQIHIPFLLGPSPHPTLSRIIDLTASAIQAAVKVFLLIGVVWLMFQFGKNIGANRDLIGFSLAGVAVLLLAIATPLVSLDYDVLRTYQQLLVILCIPAVAGAFATLGYVFKRAGFYITALLFGVYYLIVSPIVPQVVGSGYAQLELNNYGLYYNLYYTHESEYASIQWLTSQNTSDTPTYADWFATKKITSFAGQQPWIIDNVLPQNITKNSYVYQDYTNTTLGAAYTFYGGVELNYKYPSSFLHNEKDTIYTNGTTQVLK